MNRYFHWRFDERKISLADSMTNARKLASVVLILATTCLAQAGLTVHSKGKQKWPAAEAEKIYVSACSLVQGEFGNGRAGMPAITLVLGADKDIVLFDRREIGLMHWDPYLFAQGVVMLAFDDLMPLQPMPLPQRNTIANRAVRWAYSTVDAKQLAK